MAWPDERMMALDLETTSPDPEEARIVSVAIAYVGGGQETETLQMIVNPGVEIPEEAAAIHGITTERARAEGTTTLAALAALTDELWPARRRGMPLVVFNARYDLTVLDRECRRENGSKAAPEWFDCVIDPLVIDKHLDRYRRGSRKLGAICEHYGARLDAAHAADSDAIAAARLAWWLGKRAEVKRRVRDAEEGRELARLRAEWDQIRRDPKVLHAYQIAWAREQALGLAEHFRSQGNDEVVATEWPYIPAKALA